MVFIFGVIVGIAFGIFFPKAFNAVKNKVLVAVDKVKDIDIDV